MIETKFYPASSWVLDNVLWMDEDEVKLQLKRYKEWRKKVKRINHKGLKTAVNQNTNLIDNDNQCYKETEEDSLDNEFVMQPEKNLASVFKGEQYEKEVSN